MKLLLTWALNAVALLLVPYIVPGIHIESFGSALIAVVILGLVNAIIRRYGSPAAVHIEMARDLSRPFDERKKIKADQETEINGLGPVVTDLQLAELEMILAGLTKDNIVVFAGSAPASLGNEVYNRLIPVVRETGAQVVCDFEGKTLLDSLAHQPLLVKPNNHELEAIFNVELNGIADIETYAKKILEMGAQNVIISMAGDGALLVTPAATYFAKPIKGTVKNSVGAGDSMVAGFTGEFVRSQDPIEALKWGVACGTATAFSDDLASIEFIKEIYEKVEVESL